MAIIGLQRRLREAGRIRIGEQAVSSKTGKRFPKKLETFRFSSSDQRAIDMIAQAYGGKPERWSDAPVGEQWQVTTEASALSVLVPPVDFAFSQWYEVWNGGGCQKRCDGIREIISDSPCSCDPDERECKPHSRLGVILRDFSGVGLWRLDTSGYYAATELAGSVELLQLTQGVGTLTSARLMLEQRQVKRIGKDGKVETRNFAVPVLDLDIPLAALLGASHAGELTEAPCGLTPVPKAEAPALMAQIEALAEPVEQPKRSNSRLAVKATGIKPRQNTHWLGGMEAARTAGTPRTQEELDAAGKAHAEDATGQPLLTGTSEEAQNELLAPLRLMLERVARKVGEKPEVVAKACVLAASEGKAESIDQIQTVTLRDKVNRRLNDLFAGRAVINFDGAFERKGA